MCICYRLTVNLCQPTIIAFGGKVPEESDEVLIYYDVETNLIRTLSAFANSKIFEVFHRWLKDYFDKVLQRVKNSLVKLE